MLRAVYAESCRCRGLLMLGIDGVQKELLPEQCMVSRREGTAAKRRANA